MRFTRIAACGVAAWLLAVGAASADVQLSIADGRVTLVAKDATVRQILAEWARVGQTTIVNGERVPGGPVTLELHGVPESQALDTILRAASGYVAAPRAIPVANASMFDRIVVMPTSAAPPAMPVRAAGPMPPVFPQPQFGQPPQMQQPGATTDEDNDQPQSLQRPMFNTFPPPQVMNQQPVPNPAVAPPQGPLVLPQTGATNPTSPTVPSGGVSTPGMIVQPPPQPGQPVVPGQPRRPGGDNR